MSNGPYTLTTLGQDLGPGPDRRYQFPVEFGMMKKIPFQYDFDEFGPPVAKLRKDGRITFTGPVVRPTYKKGKKKGEYRPLAKQQTVKYKPNELGATIKVKETPLQRTRKRRFTEDFNYQGNYSGRDVRRFNRLRKKGFQSPLSSKGYKKILDPDTEPYRLHLPVIGQVPDIGNRLFSTFTRGMQLGAEFGNIQGGDYSSVIRKEAHPFSRLFGRGRLNPNITYKLDGTNRMSSTPNATVGGVLGSLAGTISLHGADGTEQSYLNLPIKGRFTRNKILNTIFPGFEDYAAQGNEPGGADDVQVTNYGGSLNIPILGISTNRGETKMIGMQTVGTPYSNQRYSNQRFSKIHPLIPFTGRYTIGGDDKGAPDYSGNIFKDIGQYVSRGGLDADLRSFGFPYGAAFETPVPILPPYANVFDPGRFNVKRTKEVIYNPQGGLNEMTIYPPQRGFRFDAIDGGFNGGSDGRFSQTPNRTYGPYRFTTTDENFIDY